LTKQPLPEGRAGILAALEADQLLRKADNGLWNITNLGAILFAKKLQNFQHLNRKAVRLIYTA
jgi:predicted HTH transcriptional regulator